MSKIQNFLQGLMGFKKEVPKDKSANYIAFSDTYKFFEDINQEKQLNSYKSWVYAAVSKRADEFAGLKLTLNRIKKKGDETEIEPVKNHPILELLDKVNPYLSFPDLLKITQIYKDLAGNAYWWIIKSGDTITEIWPYLRPDRISVIPSAINFIEGYKYLVPGSGEFVKFSANEIIHFKYPNPLDPYCGVAPMEACYLAYNTYLRSSEYNNSFFGNNARADFILNVEADLGDDQRKQLMTQWENRHKGTGHEHRMAILSGGKGNVLQTSMSAKDMEFIEQMKFTRDEILAIFKVPKALLDPQELNYASAKVAKEIFLNEVIVPLMKDFVSTLNEFLLPQYNDDSLFFDFEHPAEEDPITKYERYKTLSLVNAIAPNEIRAMENLPPFEGGNNIYMPFSVAPVGGEVETNQGKSFKLGKVKDIKIPKKYNVLIKSKSTTAEMRERLIKELKAEIIDKKKKVMPPEVKQKTKKELFRESFWYAKIAKTDEDEREMRKVLRKQFARQEKHVLDSLREKSFSFNFDNEGEKGIFIKIFSPFFKDIIKAYGEDAIHMVDMRDFTLSQRAKDWIANNVKKFSGEVNETTKQEIRDVLGKSVEEGESIQQAAKRIKTVFNEISTSRARTIARTEIQHASNYASVEAWKQSGVVEEKEWLTALDERVCEICGSQEGKVVNLDNKFQASDELFGHVQEPPAHINCRCTLLPVLKSKEAIITNVKVQTEKEVKSMIKNAKTELDAELSQIKDTKNKLINVLSDDDE